MATAMACPGPGIERGEIQAMVASSQAREREQRDSEVDSNLHLW
jgi:hypothetical protein